MFSLKKTVLRFKKNKSHWAYERLVDRKLREHRNNRDLAFAQAIGSLSIEIFNQQGDMLVGVLRHYGLTDGMAIFDLGCGCGRTAVALQRSGWQGSYMGTDVVQRFVEELKRKCPGYEALVHRSASIPVADSSLDMVFHWSVFTHILPEECFLYMQDIFRALKPGGKLIFSFLELDDPAHRDLFFIRSRQFEDADNEEPRDTFLHRDWISMWAAHIGFTTPSFTAGTDDREHPACWQALAIMQKPA